MNDQQDQKSQDQRGEPYKERAMNSESKQKRTIALITLAILMIALIGVTALYIGAVGSQSDKDDRITTLESEVTNLSGTRAGGETTEPEVIDSEDEHSQGGEDTTEPALPVSSPLNTYVAEVGKFSLTLGSEYGFVENLDGPGEGGSATDVDVVIQSTDNGPNVYENQAFDERIKIVASPPQSAGGNTETAKEVQDRIIADEGGVRTGTKVTFSGVEAEAIRVDGLCSTDRYVFKKNAILYSVNHTICGAVNSTLVVDIAKGFSFN